MSAPRLDINLDKISHNARMLVEDLGDRGIAVTGVTKAALGSLDIAKAMLRAGMSGLGDSRIENIEAMRQQRISAPIMLIRSPMLSQVERVVRNADISFNTELSVVRRLSAAAEEAEEIGDADVEDLFVEVSRQIDKDAWFIGANAHHG